MTMAVALDGSSTNEHHWVGGPIGLLSVVVAVANSSTRRNIKAGADGSTSCIIVQCGRGTRCVS